MRSVVRWYARTCVKLAVKLAKPSARVSPCVSLLPRNIKGVLLKKKKKKKKKKKREETQETKYTQGLA